MEKSWQLKSRVIQTSHLLFAHFVGDRTLNLLVGIVGSLLVDNHEREDISVARVNIVLSRGKAQYINLHSMFAAHGI